MEGILLESCEEVRGVILISIQSKDTGIPRGQVYLPLVAAEPSVEGE